MEAPYIIYEDGKTEEVFPEDNNTFTLQELYKLLDCDMIQTLNLGNNKIMIVDEEGKLKRNQIFNEKATEMLGYRHDFIVGKVLICPIQYFD